MPGYLDWPIEGDPSIEEEYDRYAVVYDLLFGARGDDLEYYVRVAKEALPQGGEILELGTGTGRVAEEETVEAGFSGRRLRSASMLERVNKEVPAGARRCPKALTGQKIPCHPSRRSA
ncbi:MAG: hypothetical protein U0165_12085 [Polyangiaceae bacterium]